MQMDSNIILSGAQPNILAAVQAGDQAGQQKRQYDQQNALAAMMKEQGPGIMAGNQQSLNALAQFDPQAALGIQDSRLGMDQTRQQMQFSAEDQAMARTQAKQQAETHLAQMSAADADQERQKVEHALAMATQAQSPEQWDQIMQQTGQADLVGQFGAKDIIIAGALGLKDALDAAKPAIADPLKGAPSGYMFNDPANPAAGVSMLPGYQPKSSVTVNNIPADGNSGAFNKKADEAAATRFDGIVAEGRGAQAFLGDLATLATLAPQIGTGKGAELTAALGPYADAVGIPIDGLGDAQAYQAIVDRLAPNMRPAGAGATSDFDAKQFLSSLPSLGRTPEGNAIITATLQAVQENKVKAAEIANKAFSSEITWQEADRQIAALVNPYAAFKKMKKDGIAKSSATVIDGFSIEVVQ